MVRRSHLALAVVAAAVAAVLSLVGGAASRPAGASPPPPRPSPQVDADGDRIVDALEEQLQKAGDSKAVPAIVVLEGGLEEGKLARLRQLAGDFPVSFQFPSASAFAARLTRGQAQALARSGLVAHIEPDLPMTATLDTAAYWTGVQRARQDFGLSGAGVNIAVLDSGINPNHPDLAGKVVHWRDFITGSSTPHDGCRVRHGTHVASIAAGTGAASQGRYAGVAPGAGLVVLKVLTETTVNGQSFCSTTTSIVNAAIQWAIDHRAAYNIRVMNLSLGTAGGVCNVDNTHSTARLVNEAVAAGIVVVVAAGNSGPGPCTVASPGVAARAITVGAMADPDSRPPLSFGCGIAPPGGFYLACFSSRGPTLDSLVKPDVLAPGVYIAAAYGGFDDPSSQWYPATYVSYSGTSMATPFVAGVVALMLQANPGLSPDQVKAFVTGTALDWGPAGPDNDYGAGILRAYEAIKAARGSGGAAGTVMPNHVAVQGSLPAGSGGTDCTQSTSFVEYNLYITDASLPLAATLIITNWSGSVDVDLCLFDRTGARIAISDSTTRQETIGLLSPTGSPYRLRVLTYPGSAPATYMLDLSLGGTGSPPGLYMALDAPAQGATVKEPFRIAGWALDLSSSSGPGIDYVHVWAYPAQADGTVVGPARFLGAAQLGLSRPDVGSIYGSRFDNSGYSLDASGLPSGHWRLIVYARSSVSGQVSERHRVIYVPPMAMYVDVPTWGSQARQPLRVAGWALDQAAASGAGIDYVHVWAYPSTAEGVAIGPPRFLGAAQLGLSRPDVGNVYGRQYDSAGFNLSASGLPSGYWRLIVYARSAISGQVIEQHRLVHIPPMAMYVDMPAWGQVVKQPFQVAGWALDQGAASSPAIDYVHVWAYPAQADGAVTGPPRFLGAAQLGGYRPDVGNVYGRQYDRSGFSLSATGLPTGHWRLIVYARSAISGQVIEQHRLVYIPPMAMHVDIPAQGARVGRPFAVAGWALDRAAASGVGIEYVHVWAYPARADGVVTGPPQFVGAAQLGGSRPDVGAVYGSQFNSSGFNLNSGDVPGTGYWLLIVYAKSAISGQVIEQHRLVQVMS